MIEQLPYYYRKSKVVSDLYSVIQRAIDKSHNDVEKEDAKLFITTTKDLELHEKDTGITGDSNLPDAVRRATVIAKIQGADVLTVNRLKELVTAYAPTGCTITEIYQNYTVNIALVGPTKENNYFDALKASIEEQKPAHIAITYNFTNESEGTVTAAIIGAEFLKYSIECEIPDLNITYLTDENGNALTDEDGNRLIF